MIHTKQRLEQAKFIFDVTDAYARDRGVFGLNPRPLEPLSYRFVARLTPAGAVPLEKPFDLMVQENPSGYHLFFGEIRLPDGRFINLGPEGQYKLQIKSQFYQRVEMDVDLASMHQAIEASQKIQPTSIQLLPGYGYPFSYSNPYFHDYSQPLPTQWQEHNSAILLSNSAGGPKKGGLTLLRGGLFNTLGQGIENAVVRLTPPPAGNLPYEYVTDESGQWVLVFEQDHISGEVNIQFDIPNEGVFDIHNVAVVRGRESRLAQTALRGWVLDNQGLGIPNATISVLDQSGNPFAKTSVSGDGGAWFYYFDLNQPTHQVGGAATVTGQVTVTLSDGSSLPPKSVPIRPRATTTVPTFKFP